MFARPRGSSCSLHITSLIFRVSCCRDDAPGLSRLFRRHRLPRPVGPVIITGTSGSSGAMARTCGRSIATGRCSGRGCRQRSSKKNHGNSGSGYSVTVDEWQSWHRPLGGDDLPFPTGAVWDRPFFHRRKTHFRESPGDLYPSGAVSAPVSLLFRISQDSYSKMQDSYSFQGPVFLIFTSEKSGLEIR